MLGLQVKALKFEADLTKFDKIPALLDERFRLIVEKSAYDIKGLSQYYVPVDQGVAKASHFVVTESGSERDNAIKEAEVLAATEESRYGHKGRTLGFDSEEAELQHLHAFICVAVVYGLELEFGYISGSLNVRAENPGAQRPFLTPAVLEYEKTFIAACAGAFRNL